MKASYTLGLTWTALLIGANVSNASMITHGPFSIPLSSTNWSDTISVPRFDPALGTLQSIEFELSGHVEGSAKFESLDAAPATVTMNLAAEIELQRPDTSVLVVAIPVVSTLDNVLAYDGSTDFLGDSGRTYAGLSGDASETQTSPPPAGDLALFTGLGHIDLPIVATGASTGSGAGNLILQFNTSALAEAIVRYDYTPIPEPSAMSLFAVCGVVAVRKRRQRHEV